MKREFYESFLAKLAANDGNKGRNGVNAEVLVRDAFLKNGIANENDMRARLLNQVDFSFRKDGKVYNGEVKTGAGAVLYGDFCKADVDALTEDDIFPEMDYIVFGIEGAMINEATFRKVMVVFTRDQFVDMLVFTGKHGLRSSLRLGHVPKGETRGTQIQIQEWKTKTCEKRYAMFWQYVEDNNIPDLDTFLTSIGRG